MSVAAACAVVGAGAQTAVGRSLLSSAAAVRAGLSRLRPHPVLVDLRGRRVVTAHAGWLGRGVDGVDRYLALARRAAGEALAPLDALRDPRRRADHPVTVRAVVALPAGRDGRPDALEDALPARLLDALRLFARVEDVTTVAAGHAGGLVALERAARALDGAGRDAPIWLVGGVDSWIDPDAIDALEDAGRLHGVTRWGRVPGEAAGFVLLASREAAAHHGLRPLAWIDAIAAADEPRAPGADPPPVGEGLSAAARAALARVDGRVDHVVTDANGEPARGDELGFTLARIADRIAAPPRIVAPADAWGDVGAASGPLFVGLAVAAALRGAPLGPRALLLTSSDTRHRAAAVVRLERASADQGQSRTT